MSRRRKSANNLPWIFLLAGIFIIGFLGARFFAKSGSDPWRQQETLNVDIYMENSNSLRGNIYKIKGEVLNALAHSPSQGRLFSMGVEEGDDVLPVLIPLSLNHVNIQKGQKFILLLEVMDNGILRAKEMKKI